MKDGGFGDGRYRTSCACMAASMSSRADTPAALHASMLGAGVACHTTAKYEGYSVPDPWNVKDACTYPRALTCSKRGRMVTLPDCAAMWVGVFP